MADGKLIFETGIDTIGFEVGIEKIGTIAKNGLKDTKNTLSESTKEITNLGLELGKLDKVFSGMSTAATGYDAINGLSKILAGLGIVASTGKIGLAIAGITALLATIDILHKSTESEIDIAQDLIDKSKDKQAAIQGEIDAYRGLQEESSKTIASDMRLLDLSSELYDNLSELVDINGKVKDGQEESAQNIVDSLSKALGIEIDLIDGQIIKYGELKGAIDDAANAKKADILMESKGDLYQEALVKKEDAWEYEREAYEKHQEALNDVKLKNIELDKLLADESDKISEDEFDNKVSNQKGLINLAKQNAEETKKEYDKAVDAKKMYTEQIEDIEAAYLLIAEGKYEEAVDLLERRSEAEKLAAMTDGKTAEEKRKILEEEMQRQKELYDEVSQGILEGNNDFNKDMLADIVEYQKIIKDEMDTLTFNATEGAVSGFVRGMPNVFDEVNKMASGILRRFADNFQIKSPSRVMKKMFEKDFTDGIVLGIKGGTPKVLGQVTAMSQAAIKTARDFSKDYKSLGENYIDLMSEGIDDKVDSMIKSKQFSVDALLGTAIFENKEAEKACRDDAKKLMKAYTEALKDGGEEAKEVIAQTIRPITEEWQKQTDEILRKQEDMRSKLGDYGGFFEIDSETGNATLNKIEDNIKALERYDYLLSELKKKEISDGLMGEITGLGIDEALAVAEKLNGLAPTQFTKVVTQWEEQQKKAKEIAIKFYEEEIDTIDKEFSAKLTEALTELPLQVEEIGVNTIQGFTDGMLSEKENAVNAAREIMEAVKEVMQQSVEVNSPSRWAKRVIGKNLALGISKGYEEEMPSMEKSLSTETLTALEGLKNAVSASSGFVGGGGFSSVVKESSSVKEVSNNTVIKEKVVGIDCQGGFKEVARVLRPYIVSEQKRIGGNLIANGV